MARPTRQRAPRRDVHGVLLLDKPAGMSSHAALRAAQRLYGAAKAGHTGTLDPLATGLLPACFGDATRFSHLLLDSDKAYRAGVRLGMTTATGDLEGEVTGRAPVAVSREQVEAVMRRFLGVSMQVPPMYSAIKQDGEPLYKLARAGLEVPRAPRAVTIREISLLGMSGHELYLAVTCSKGTYIRVLAEDIGRELGCGACLSALRRTGVGAFALDRGALTLSELEAMAPAERDAALLPPDALLASLPQFDLDAEQARRLLQGQAVERAGVPGAGLARVYGPGRRFLGLAEVTGQGRVVPRRLLSQAATELGIA
jgi:tRNA pseudouridine55 synthase